MDEQEMAESQLFRDKIREIEEAYQKKLGESQQLKQVITERNQYLSDTTERYEKLVQEHEALKNKWEKFNDLFGTAKEAMEQRDPSGKKG